MMRSLIQLIDVIVFFMGILHGKKIEDDDE